MTTETCTCPSGDGSLRWPCPVHPPETVADLLKEFRFDYTRQRGLIGDDGVDRLCTRIQAAHARDAKDAARYRCYRATTVKPTLFGDDGWSEEDTDRVIDDAMSKQEVK